MQSSRSTYPRESGQSTDDTTASAVSQAFDVAGLQVTPTNTNILLGTAPYEPRVLIPLSRVAASGDASDLTGYLNSSGATITDLNTTYLNATGADIVNLQNEVIETESITTGGKEIYVDWQANATNLPALAIINNPLKTLKNSDGSDGAFNIGEFFLKEGESLAETAAMYIAQQAGGWLLSAASDAFNMMSGYAAIGEGAASIGGDAAGAAIGSDLALFEAGSEGMVMASSASEAASLFGSAGVLAEGGLAFSSAEGEIGESLLLGIENSSGSFVQEAMPDYLSTLTGASRWVAF